MMILWRVTKPERPRRQEGSPITTKWTTILSVAGLGIESTEAADWTADLSEDEARHAALHACLSEQGYPEWIESLVDSHPQTVLPVLNRRLKAEWVSPQKGGLPVSSSLRESNNAAPNGA